MCKKKTWLSIGLTGVCLLLLIVLPFYVSISGEPRMAGGAVCISFDKWDMLRADKIILKYRGETHTITNPELVRAFTEETLSGTYSDYCCANQTDGWVEIYRGDRLLRHMRFISNHDGFAYEADAAHWVLFGKEGHAFLSPDLREALYETLGDT